MLWIVLHVAIQNKAQSSSPSMCLLVMATAGDATSTPKGGGIYATHSPGRIVGEKLTSVSSS